MKLRAHPVKLDPAFPLHPKIGEAGPLASWLYVTSLCYANLNRTDGFVSSQHINTLVSLDGIYVESGAVLDTFHEPATVAALADRLTAVGLWHPVPTGIVIHDYADYQPTRESLEKRQEQAKHRKSRWRSSKERGTTAFPPAVNSSVLHSSPSPKAAATTQSPAALSLRHQLQDAVAVAESDPVAYVVDRLDDAQGQRTVSAIRSVLAKWDLKEAAVLEAFTSLQAVKERGGPHKGDSAYLVGTLNRMGEKREHAA